MFMDTSIGWPGMFWKITNVNTFLFQPTFELKLIRSHQYSTLPIYESNDLHSTRFINCHCNDERKTPGENKISNAISLHSIQTYKDRSPKKPNAHPRSIGFTIHRRTKHLPALCNGIALTQEPLRAPASPRSRDRGAPDINPIIAASSPRVSPPLRCAALSCYDAGTAARGWRNESVGRPTLMNPLKFVWRSSRASASKVARFFCSTSDRPRPACFASPRFFSPRDSADSNGPRFRRRLARCGSLADARGCMRDVCLFLQMVSCDAGAG